jgi:hypothetical protein
VRGLRPFRLVGVLWLVHVAGCNSLFGLEDRSLGSSPDGSVGGGSGDGSKGGDSAGSSGDAAAPCLDTTSDPLNCGTCGNDCTALPNVLPAITCSGGHCDVSGACVPSFGHCTTSESDGCETNLTTAATCGACSTACTAPTVYCTAPEPGASAMDGGFVPYVCATSCSAATPTTCGMGSCTNTQTSLTNCGVCGMICASEAHAIPECVAGLCELACDPGYTQCAGSTACTDLQTDPMNCGTCGMACPQSSVCVAGACNDGDVVISSDTALASGTHVMESLTVNAGATLTTPGGKLDIHVSGAVRILGTIDVSGGAGGVGVGSVPCVMNPTGAGTGGETGNPLGIGGTSSACASACTTDGGANGDGVVGGSVQANCWTTTTGIMVTSAGGANGGGAGGPACGVASDYPSGVGGGGGGGFAGGGGGGAQFQENYSFIVGASGASASGDTGGAGALSSTEALDTPSVAGGGAGPTGYAGAAGAANNSTCSGGGGGGAIGASAVADLPVATTFRTGSGGGGGSGSFSCPANGGGGGGGGGGALRIISDTSIAISGSVLANGGAGGAAGESDAGATSAGGGGGGSGGVIYLGAPEITLGSMGVVSAVGGAGGKGCTGAGGAGGLGRIRLSVGPAACSVTGTLNPPLPLAGCASGTAATAGETYVGEYTNGSDE